MEISRPRNYSNDVEAVYDSVFNALYDGEGFQAARISDVDGYPVLKVRHEDGTLHSYKVQLTEVVTW